MIKNSFIVLLLIILFSNQLYSQNNIYRDPSLKKRNLSQIDSLKIIDSLVSSRRPIVNQSYRGVSIFSLLSENSSSGSSVNIYQPDSLYTAINKYLAKNNLRTHQGYRLRIFLDNKQSARVESEKMERDFIFNFPDIRTYRIYTYPYFKVTVGDFRTKSEAMRVMSQVKKIYPSVFVVREDIWTDLDDNIQ